MRDPGAPARTLPSNGRPARRWGAAWLLLVWLGFLPLTPAVAVAETIPPAAAGVASRVTGDFPPDGVYPATTWPDAGPHPRTWGSWAGGDARTGTLTLGPFRAPRRLRLAVAGFPTGPGNSLALRRVADGATRPCILFDPHETWVEIVVELPADWVGQAVEIVATDAATGPGGWLGVSEPFTRDALGARRPVDDPGPGGLAAWLPAAEWRRDGSAVAAFGLNFVLLLAPGLALLPAFRRRVTVADSFAPLLAVGLGALLAYGLFWLYWLRPPLGRAGSWAVELSSVGALLWAGRHRAGRARA